MHLHLTAIVPLTVAMILLTLGLHYDQGILTVVSALLTAYGFVAHTKNVEAIRRNRNYW